MTSSKRTEQSKKELRPCSRRKAREVRFLHAEEAAFYVAAMCGLLGVTRQGCYAYAGRPPSARVESDAELAVAVREVFGEGKQDYGSPRVLRAVHARGLHVGRRAATSASCAASG
jgi:hypothetical protein